MRKQVFIVEGAHDASKLVEVLGPVHIITTNGSEISSDTLDVIKTLDETHDLIIFTDPDFAGERIRKIVSKDLQNVYHAFLKRQQAFSKNKKKIGIEHASKQDILEALSHMQLVKNQSICDIDMAFLYDYGLIGQANSKDKRAYLSEQLHLGHVNAKTLIKRLMLFGIDKKKIEEVMNESST